MLNKIMGEIEMASNKYMKALGMVREDDMTIITTNVRCVKGNPVLVVNNNEAVYLKDWNMAGCMVKTPSGQLIEAFAVKVSRRYWKTYTFRSDFDGFDFDQADTYESLEQVAKEQQESGCTYKLCMFREDHRGGYCLA